MTKLAKLVLLTMSVSMLLSVGCSRVWRQPVKEVPLAPQVGKLTPDFQLPRLNGTVVSLSDLRGKPVLINFWATWCPPCRKEMPYLQQIYDVWSDKGLMLLTIDMGESPSVIKEFMQNRNLTMPVLLDMNQNVARRYNLTAIPTTFLIDKNGIVQLKKIGAFPSTEAIERELSRIMP